MSTKFLTVGLLAFGVLHVPATGHAQPSAADVLKRSAERFEDILTDIDDLTVIVHAEGDMAVFDQMTTYYRKVLVGERPAFEQYVEFSGGLAESPGGAYSGTRPLNLFGLNRLLYEQFADTAVYEGTERVDGATTHVLFIEDFGLLAESYYDEPLLQADPAFKNARLFIDEQEGIIRRIAFETSVHDPGNGSARDLAMTVNLQDYRRVGEALLYPFRITTTRDNPMSIEHRAELESQRQQIEATLAQLPESQQAQMRKMLGSLGGDQLSMTLITEDVLLNQGVPEALFHHR